MPRLTQYSARGGSGLPDEPEHHGQPHGLGWGAVGGCHYPFCVRHRGRFDASLMSLCVGNPCIYFGWKSSG